MLVSYFGIHEFAGEKVDALRAKEERRKKEAEKEDAIISVSTALWDRCIETDNEENTSILSEAAQKVHNSTQDGDSIGVRRLYNSCFTEEGEFEENRFCKKFKNIFRKA
jgi:hypothetical protein